MAFQIHVTYVNMQNVNSLGVVVKTDGNTPLKQRLDSTMEARVIEDSNIPNTINSPTIKTYLELEAADDFVAEYISQTMIVTYQRTSDGGFA